MTTPTTAQGYYEIRPTMCPAASRLLWQFSRLQSSFVGKTNPLPPARDSGQPELVAAWEAYRDHRASCAECAKITAQIKKESEPCQK